MLGGFVGLVGCLSAGVRSTGTLLPQTPDEISNDAVSVKISYDCSGDRCSGITARFENRLSERIEIPAVGIKLQRAGAELLLIEDEELPAKFFSIPPRDTLKVDFVAKAPKSLRPMTFVRPKEVWCLLKQDSQCTNAAEGEAQCAAAARSYYRQHIDLQGWVSLVFPVKAASWKQHEVLVSPAPAFMGVLPATELTEREDAPRWIGPNYRDMVFIRYECDAQCACLPLETPRDFMKNDKFLPVEK
jgi:hypothetical protein